MQIFFTGNQYFLTFASLKKMPMIFYKLSRKTKLEVDGVKVYTREEISKKQILANLKHANVNFDPEISDDELMLIIKEYFYFTYSVGIDW